MMRAVPCHVCFGCMTLLQHCFEKGLEKVRNLAAKGECPLVLLPSHRSYVDFIILSYIFFAYNLPLPHILAGEDFLGLGVLSTMLRHAGAFFIKRPFPNDVVYQAIFNEYIQRLLEDKQVVEFFLAFFNSLTSGNYLTFPRVSQ